jgi:hypothetical protein
MSPMWHSELRMEQPARAGSGTYRPEAGFLPDYKERFVVYVILLYILLEHRIRYNVWSYYRLLFCPWYVLSWNW